MGALLQRLQGQRMCSCGYYADPNFCTKCGRVTLKRRPRWKRIARLPLQTFRMWRIGCLPLRECARIAWVAAIWEPSR